MLLCRYDQTGSIGLAIMRHLHHHTDEYVAEVMAELVHLIATRYEAPRLVGELVR